MAQATAPIGAAQNRSLWRHIKRHRWVYAFIAPGCVYLLLFAYWPMYGITVAFKDYNMRDGILSSPWSAPIYKNFNLMLVDRLFWGAFWNSFRIGFMTVLLGFFPPIFLALLMNELRLMKYKRVLQTIFTFPNFMSWVICAGLIKNLLLSTGMINTLLRSMGAAPIDFLANRDFARPLLYISGVWKNVGWGSIIYMAAIAAINVELYEAAEVDGANRFQRMWHITWPGIRPTATILLILSFGGIVGGNFDQIMNMSNPIVRNEMEVMGTYIYRRTFQNTPNYGFSTAMGLVSSVINFAFLLAANRGAKLLGEGGIM